MCVITAYGVQCLVAGFRGSGTGQQAVSPGRGMLHDAVVQLNTHSNQRSLKGSAVFVLRIFFILLIWYLLKQGIYQDECKGGAVPVRTLKAYRGSRGISPLTLDLDTRWV
jgi:hypothetical protein